MNSHEQQHPRLYTVGHSNHTIEAFLNLLKSHKIDTIADVRSSPYSAYNPQFCREALEASLRKSRISYVFLGRELGARRDESECYIDGQARYERVAETRAFRDGLDRVRKGLVSRRIALMCSEKDPLTCHRTVLVSRHLDSSGLELSHILFDGALESHEDAKRRLIRETDQATRQFSFDQDEQLESAIDSAYRIRGEKIAFRHTNTKRPSVSKDVN